VTRRAARAATPRSVWIGCSGWNYADWRETFYPKGLPARRWLEYYAQHFDTVEVNNTFYRLPSRDAVANWAAQTPRGFVFAVKASRYLTHIKRLSTVAEGWQRFHERIEPLIDAGKLGPVLWQLPGNFRCDLARLDQALDELPPGKHCFEFRHPSWFNDDVYEALRRRAVALVIGDHPERPFQTYEFTAEWTYLRFHYGARGRGGNYSKTELETWSRRIAQWRRTVDVYAYFNNDWRTYAVRNALALERALA
jgi:uncharacterized protein YecE (DUF72 family)